MLKIPPNTMNRILPTVVAFLSLQIGKLKKILMQFSQIYEDSCVWLFDEITGFKTVLNGKMKYLLIILFLTLGSFNQVFGAARFAVTTGNWNGAIWASTAGGVAGSAA